MIPNTIDVSGITENTFALFEQAEEIYREYLYGMSVKKNISKFEEDRLVNNFSVIKEMVCEHLHNITDINVLSQLYRFLERNKQYFWSSIVMNIYYYNTAKPEVWETIRKGFSENKDKDSITKSLLGFFRYYDICRYLVSNYNRHLGIPDCSNKENRKIISRQSCVQLSLF